MSSDRLQAILDKDAIRDVLMRYARGIDRGDFELVRSAFHPDAVEVHGDFEGPSHQWIDQLGEGRPGAKQHSLGHSLIDLAGDAADVETYVTAVRMQGPEDGGPRYVLLHGRYLDRFERRDGVWRIARRTAVLDVTWETTSAREWSGAAAFVSGGRYPDDPVYRRTPD